jgi:phosphatidylglycerophosphatase A
MKSSTEVSSVPRLALLVATGFGLGYLPLAPGTWGSLGGVAIYWALARVPWSGILHNSFGRYLDPLVVVPLLVAFLGVWSAARVEHFVGQKDPQFVVIDEISGQQMTYLLALAPANWKYLLLGFILFRVFDIWKPFPIRRVESWAGGGGFRGDDWAAGLYAALGLWLARAARL